MQPLTESSQVLVKPSFTVPSGLRWKAQALLAVADTVLWLGVAIQALLPLAH
jgi:hypothetical protein